MDFSFNGCENYVMKTTKIQKTPKGYQIECLCMQQSFSWAEINGKLQLLAKCGITICSSSSMHLSKAKSHHINDATFDNGSVSRKEKQIGTQPEVMWDSLFTVFIKFVKSTLLCLYGGGIWSHRLGFTKPCQHKMWYNEPDLCPLGTLVHGGFH